MILNPKQLSYLARCVEKNIELLDSVKDEHVISELQKIQNVLTDKTFILDFDTDSSTFQEVDECLNQLKELTSLYSNMADLHILTEYDVIKKRFTSLLEYLATLKDRINNDVTFNEDVLKKEFKALITKLLNEEQGISLTQAEKLVYADPRYSTQLRRLRPYINYAQITKTKYDLYMKILQAITQSVSTASKELNANKHYSGMTGQ